MELFRIFEELNLKFFDGFLEPPQLRWNSRLRSSAGRFIPGHRKFFREHPPIIEIASYLLEEVNASALVADTMGHELIHYWLWVRRRPFGHTPEFWEKMELMGVSRYNTVARPRPYRYVYRCPECATEFPARKRLGSSRSASLACGKCCKLHSSGKYDARFKLVLERTLSREEGHALYQARKQKAADAQGAL